MFRGRGRPGASISQIGISRVPKLVLSTSARTTRGMRRSIANAGRGCERMRMAAAGAASTLDEAQAHRGPV